MKPTLKIITQHSTVAFVLFLQQVVVRSLILTTLITVRHKDVPASVGHIHMSSRECGGLVLQYTNVFLQLENGHHCSHLARSQLSETLQRNLPYGGFRTPSQIELHNRT